MKVVVTSPVNHDGVDLEVGATLDLTDEAGQALVDAGAAVAAGTKSKPAKPAPEAQA